jgi:hypothetical protein
MTRALNILAILCAGLLAWSPGCGDDDDGAGDGDTDSDSDSDMECSLGEYLGDFTINTQADTALIAGYSSISGTLEIHCEDCTELSELACLNAVGGDLLMWNSHELASLDGLDNIDSVGGSLMIGYDDGVGYRGNDSLADISALSGITSVGVDVTVIDNPILTNVSGLIGITSLEGELDIRYNSALSDLGGLGSITSVGGDLTIACDENLPDLEGLNALTSVGGRLSIGETGDGPNDNDAYVPNEALASLAALSSLTSAGGILIGDNPVLASLDGLQNVSGSLPYWLYVVGNDVLTDLDCLSGITSVGETLRISGNGALTDLDGLSSITGPIESSLRIIDNEVLVSLDGLNGVTSAGQNLAVLENDSLVSLAGLDQIASASILSISNNGALVSLDGLSALTSVSEDFMVHDNTNLPDCEPCELLDQLTAEPEFVDVHSNLADSCTPVPDNCP